MDIFKSITNRSYIRECDNPKKDRNKSYSFIHYLKITAENLIYCTITKGLPPKNILNESLARVVSVSGVVNGIATW